MKVTCAAQSFPCSILYLIRNPTILAKLTNEIRSAFGSLDDIRNPKLGSLPYLSVLRRGDASTLPSQKPAHFRVKFCPAVWKLTASTSAQVVASARPSMSSITMRKSSRSHGLMCPSDGSLSQISEISRKLDLRCVPFSVVQ